jgi:DNA-binding NtrC family response regulator
LVVEDDPIIAKAITVCLQIDQHQVRTAPDVPSGVALLQREPADLILTDLFTPTFSPDAFAELATFTEMAPATPIVVTTAHARAATFDPAQYGVAAILLKPFSARDLRAVVQQILVAHQQQVQSLEAHLEQSWDHVRSAEQHIGDSVELLRRVLPRDHFLPWITSLGL